MRISVDREKCTGLGICESLSPEVFEIDEDGALVLKDETVPDELVDEVRQAVDGCPTAALRLVS